MGYFKTHVSYSTPFSYASRNKHYLAYMKGLQRDESKRKRLHIVLWGHSTTWSRVEVLVAANRQPLTPVFWFAQSGEPFFMRSRLGSSRGARQLCSFGIVNRDLERSIGK